jgi:hypothetical protein
MVAPMCAEHSTKGLKFGSFRYCLGHVFTIKILTIALGGSRLVSARS